MCGGPSSFPWRLMRRAGLALTPLSPQPSAAPTAITRATSGP